MQRRIRTGPGVRVSVRVLVRVRVRVRARVRSRVRPRVTRRVRRTWHCAAVITVLPFPGMSSTGAYQVLAL